MRTTSDNEMLNTHDSKWFLITQFTCHDSTLHEDLDTDLCLDPFMQTIKELGLQPEYLRKIEGTIIETVNRARLNFHLARLNLPIDIRMYCQIRTKEAALPSNNSKYTDAGISIGTLQDLLEINISLDNPEGYMNGGWGYFLIERGNDLASATRTEPHCIIELYLYKEGE